MVEREELSNKLVSIITPVLNGKEYIESTINSVERQTYSNIEYIIIDGGSTDGTVDVIKSYQNEFSHRYRWVSQDDESMYEAVNEGLSLASGSILAYLNSDDLYDDNEVVKKVVKFFEKNPDVGWVYSDVHIIDQNDNILYTYKKPEFNWKEFASIDWSYIPQPTTFWRKEVVEQLNGFDDSFKMASDYDFFLRAGKDFKGNKLPFIVARFRKHSGSLTSQRQDINRQEMARIKDKHSVKDIHFLHFRKLVFWFKYKLVNFPVYVKKIYLWGSNFFQPRVHNSVI